MAVSGLAVALATAGGVLLYTGVRNVSVVDGLRDVLQGKVPGGTTKTGPSLKDTRTSIDDLVKTGTLGSVFPSGTPGTELGAKIVAVARQQLGKPYLWGAAGPLHFDCSGLVSFCLKAVGADDQRRVTAQYLVWNGAVTIDKAQAAAGDLVCWTGHIGIATSQGTMIHAPHPGTVVKEATIVTPGAVYRRVKG